MAIVQDYMTGTVSANADSNAVIGVGTAWKVAPIRSGDMFMHGGYGIVIDDVIDDTHLTLAENWPGANLVASEYRIRIQPDGSRYTAAAIALYEKLGNGNIDAFAGLIGAADWLPIFTGPGAMTIVRKSDLINGVRYDVSVDTLAERADFDTNPAGFSVLVSDIGDGRAAIYTKNTATSGDWSDPAYITGPVGPMPTVDATATTLDPGNDATVTVTPVVGGYTLDLGIPAGRGQVTKGDYDAGTAYVLDDAVLDNGSTWIALQATTGNAPPVLPATSNAYWQLLARKGTDGTGIGDVVGPAGTTADQLAVFDGVTGKLIKSGGKTIADIEAAAVLPGALHGLTLSNNAGNPVTDVDIAIGRAASDDAAPVMMVLGSPLIKRLTDPWAVGNWGGLDTGTVADGTYHVFLIMRSDTGVVDVLFSLSPTAPTMPANYDRKRRIGFVIRAGGSIVAFTQNGDIFKYVTETTPLNNGTEYTDILAQMVPSAGVRVVPLLVFSLQNGATGFSIILLGDGDEPTARISVARAAAANEYSLASTSNFITDTAGQLRYTFINPTGTALDVRIFCQGWIDGRGQ